MARIRRMTDYALTVEEETHKVNVAKDLIGFDMSQTIVSDVAAGKRTLSDALLAIEDQQSAHRRRQIADAQVLIDFINRQRKDGHYTDTQAAVQIS